MKYQHAKNGIAKATQHTRIDYVQCMYLNIAKTSETIPQIKSVKEQNTILTTQG